MHPKIIENRYYEFELDSGTTLIIKKLTPIDRYFSILSNKNSNKSRGDFKRIGTIYNIEPLLEVLYSGIG